MLLRARARPLKKLKRLFSVIYECSQSTTPPPNGCKFENTYRYDGEVFTAQDGCNKCWCNKGEIICPYENDCENSVARRRSLNKSS